MPRRLIRWCLLRLKRTLLLTSFLLVILTLVICAFISLNQDHAQFNGIKAHLHGGKGLGPDTHDVMLISKQNRSRYSTLRPRQRPMVQFYPDNQNRLLYRKVEYLNDADVVVPLNLNVPDLDVKSTHSPLSTLSDSGPLCQNCHVFYYAWYANPVFDGSWRHWNHKYLPNWDQNDHRAAPRGSHDPEKFDIAANFYPQLGAYSSIDPEIIKKHMVLIKQSKIGVLVVSWYPPNFSDPNGSPVDNIIPILLDAAHTEGLKLTLHFEPYPGRNISSVRRDLEYIHKKYVHSPAFYRTKQGKPMFYIYDSYLISDMYRLLTPSGDMTIRSTKLDAIMIGLLVDFKDRLSLKASGFNGFYTYFGSNGFTYGASWKNWRGLATFAKKNSLLFIPSVAPGYNDIRIRPWNGATTRLRRKGAYYDIAWRTLIELNLQYASITSFNEWHEGTQIEPAVPMNTESFTYGSYEPFGPDFYIRKTREWIEKFFNSREMSEKNEIK